MNRYNWENWVIVLLGIAIAVVPLFSQQSRGILVHGGSIAFAVPFILKGVSRLKCAISDVVLTVLVLTLVLFATLARLPFAPPLSFEIAALVVIAIFTTTGLTFKAIAREQRIRMKRS
jgi:hypothetical protein